MLLMLPMALCHTRFFPPYMTTNGARTELRTDYETVFPPQLAWKKRIKKHVYVKKWNLFTKSRRVLFSFTFPFRPFIESVYFSGSGVFLCLYVQYCTRSWWENIHGPWYYFAERLVSHSARTPTNWPDKRSLLQSSTCSSYLSCLVFFAQNVFKSNTTDHKKQKLESCMASTRGRCSNSGYVWVWLATHARGR